MMQSTSFGAGNRGQQVGLNYGTVNAEFHLPPERAETPPAPSATIPFSRDPDFVNRGDILVQIDQRCSKPAARMALVGLGGVGKSQLAIEFAHRIATGQPDTWIFWVYASTQARIEEGFRTIADAVKLPGRNQTKADIPQLVYGWLSNERNGKWIIILDSADDRDVFYAANGGREGKPLASYLPQSRNGSILITTRSKDLAFRLTGSHKNIEVGPMALGDALLLLEKKLDPLSDMDAAKDLVQALDLIPLAISQAAAYIQARLPMSSVTKYLAEFRKCERKRAQLLKYDAGDLRRDGGASNAISTTWEISFKYIRSRRPSTADLLSLMSFFDRQGISPSLLRPVDVKTIQQVTHLAASEDSGSESGSGSSGDEGGRFEDDVAMLRDFCLITVDEDGSAFEIHGLVQLSTRRWLESDGLQDKFRQQFIKRIATAFPTGDYDNWATCRQLFAHVEAAIDQRPAEESIEEWASLMYNGGWYAWSQGRYKVAERMIGKAQRNREKTLGKDDKKTLDSMLLFATVLLDQGRWEEAKKLFMQVMETRKTKLGADHPDTLTSMANLASTFWNQGRWEEAEKLFVQVMETRKTKLGANHPDTLSSMANLAFTWKSQGRHANALALMEDCTQAQRRVLGQKHPETLSSLATVAKWSS